MVAMKMQQLRLLSAPQRIAAGAVLGVSLLGMSGCQNINISSSNVSEVRVIAASVNAPGIDFYQSSAALAYNLGFGTVTSYVASIPGTYTLTADTAGSKQVLTQTNATLQAGKQYTALVGNVASSLQTTLLVDQSTPAPTGEISVRFIDQATRVGNVDVYLVPSGGKLTTTSALVTNINFNTNTGYINVPYGTYSIAVLPTGTIPTTNTTTLLSGPQVGYAAGAVRTVVLIDTQVTTQPGVGVIVADDFDLPTS